MIKNYIKIAWRNIIKSKFYSFVNIVGLSAGLAFTLIIAAYVWSELQVNKHLKNADRQYIIQSKWKDPNMGYDLATLGPLAKELRIQYPNLVANFYRFDGVSVIVSKGDKQFRESLQAGDSTMLTMYGLNLLYGDVNTALKDPYSVVITKEEAIKFFGKENAVGQTLAIQNFSGTKKDFVVTGVLVKNFRNSVTTLNDANNQQLFIPESSQFFPGRDLNQWANQYMVGFIELQKGVKPEDLTKPMQQLIRQNTPEQIAANLTPYLVPLKEYYLKANNSLVEKTIYALSFIAFFILLMAVINFVNVSVSRSATRLKEIGIRKVLGSQRKQLIIQFLTESVVLVFFSTILSVIIYIGTRNYFSSILGKEIPRLSEFPVYYVVCPLALTLMVGLLAGIYPAFMLSAMKSVDSLKGKQATVKEKIGLRKSLVGFQFGVASVVLISAIIVSSQIQYFFSQNLGYNKDYIVSAQVPRDWTPKGVQHIEAIRNEYEAMPEVMDASLSYEIPDGNSSGQAPVYKFGTDSTQAIAAQTLETDEKFLSVYQIPLKAGSFFNGHGLDSGKVVMNEAAIHALGWQNASDAIGQRVRIPGDPTVFTIKGVTNDFHFGSMQQKVAPIILFNVEFAPIYRYLSFKIKAGNVSTTIAALQKKWQALMPDAPFEYNFMDDTLKKVYTTEIQLKKATYTATVLALVIVLLGVLGLISLSIQKRTKEISIRKVLGASVQGIIALFMKEFLMVIVVAGITACPLAYIIMHHWLSSYAYRINITAMPFMLAFALLTFITALLIVAQTIKAANASPVNGLRSE